MGETTDFKVTFHPFTAGLKKTTVRIGCDSPSISPFIFSLSATPKVNSPPIFSPLSVATGRDMPLSVTLSSVLANAYDYDGGKLTITSV
jgi:hypothetical protein